MRLLRRYPLTLMLAVSWLAIIFLPVAGLFAVLLIPLAVPAYIPMVALGGLFAALGTDVPMAVAVSASLLIALALDRYVVPVFLWSTEAA